MLELPASVAFGRFRLLPHRRELLANGQPIRLGGRAYDVLLALIEAHGAVRQQGVADSPRVGGPDRRGECPASADFGVASRVAGAGADPHCVRARLPVHRHNRSRWRQMSASAPVQVWPTQADGLVPPPSNLPEPVSELIGRSDAISECLSLVNQHRLVTLTGAGGIGKTRLAVATAHRLLPEFADGVWLTEFSPLADPGLVPAAVATALGLGLAGEHQRASRRAGAGWPADFAVAGYLRTCGRRRGHDGRIVVASQPKAARHRDKS